MGRRLRRDVSRPCPAMVLGGALNPALGTTERRLTQYAGFQRAFDLMAASCAQSPDCVLGTDPAESTARFHTINASADRRHDRHAVAGGHVQRRGRRGDRRLVSGRQLATGVGGHHRSGTRPRRDSARTQRHVRRTRRRRSVVELLGGALRHQLHRRTTTHPRTGREPARRRLRGCTLHGSGVGVSGARDGCDPGPPKTI
ncbi:hypothetical protein GS575_11590 [Rhodococcus hoagii]|nr:hypothetical protein [Prescottella equi]